MSVPSIITDQPIDEWERGIPSSTLRHVFKSSTPWLAHDVRSGLWFSIPISDEISLKILHNDLGILWSSFDENDSPFA